MFTPYYLCSFVKEVYKAMFCTLTLAILIGRAAGVRIRVVSPTVIVSFVGERCLLCSV